MFAPMYRHRGLSFNRKLCDALSRLQVDKFRTLAPEADSIGARLPLADLGRGVNRLLGASLAPNTALAYKTALSAFSSFLSEFGLPKTYPISPNHLVLFITYVLKKYFPKHN